MPATFLKYLHRLFLSLSLFLIIALPSVLPAQKNTVYFSKAFSDGIRRIGILPIEFKTYHFTSGSIHEYTDSLSGISKNLLLGRVNLSLKNNGFTPFLILEGSIEWEAWLEVKDLCRTVELSLAHHIYGSDVFYPDLKSSDYSIGSVEELCAHNNLDALLVIWGVDEKKTSKRERTIEKARTAAGVSLGVGLLLGAVIIAPVPREDLTFLSGTLINKDGKIVWYNTELKYEDIDMLKAVKAEWMADELLAGSESKNSSESGYNER